MVIPFIVWNWNGKITLFFGFVYIRNGKMFDVKGLPLYQNSRLGSFIYDLNLMIRDRNTALKGTDITQVSHDLETKNRVLDQ